MKKLLIFEKPSQAKAVCSAFTGVKYGKQYHELPPHEYWKEGAIAVWCIGHILEPVMPEEYDVKYKQWKLEHLPIIPEEFKLKVSPDKKAAYTIIRKWVNDATVSIIIHCGDPGREGCLLVDEVLLFSNNRKPVERLWTTSLTPSAVHKAMKQLKDNKHYQSIYYEAVSRQRADWVIGINASRAMTCLLGEKGLSDLFSIGRVQTGTLSIIYRREMEIKSFQSEPFWDVFLDFSTPKGDTYRGKWFKQGEEHVFNEAKAKALGEYCKEKEAVVTSVVEDRKFIPAPQLFNLTHLTAVANSLYKMAPDRVLSVAQELYEKKIISYPRSEPRHVSKEEAKEFPSILKNLGEVEAFKHLLPVPIQDISSNKRFVDDTKVDDHYAIIPTELVPNLDELSADEKRIYELIAKSLIAAHYPPAEEDVSEVITTVDNHFTFKTKGRKLVADGWRKVFGMESDSNSEENETDEGEAVIPSLKESELVAIQSLEIKEGKTSPPKRFPHGQLPTIMKNAYAYLTADEKQGFKTEELRLGTVATRSNVITQLMKRKFISVRKNLVYCEPKGQLLIELLGEKNWLASPLTTGAIEQVLAEIGAGTQPHEPFLNRINVRVKELIHELMEQSKEWSIPVEMKQSLSSNNQMNHNQESSIGACKLCGEPVVDKGKFYGCSAYSKTSCNFTVNKVVAKKEIPLDEIKKLLNEDSTSLIKGFISSSSGNPFDAFLVWNDASSKVKFRSWGR
ncbi:DNA topoisomerase 3 [Bacillus salitolerans]|uniref:DNA topoisomerase n=1 Tax=Bacillus salitolerans TaxID=1437434 RepID=A0ABW4LMM6_9BACI